MMVRTPSPSSPPLPSMTITCLNARERYNRARADAFLTFLAHWEAHEGICETIYSLDSELLETCRWLMAFNVAPHQAQSMIPTRRIWALAWRVNLAFPSLDRADIVERAEQTLQRWRVEDGAGSGTRAATQFYRLVDTLSARQKAEQTRLQRYQTVITHCALPTSIRLLGNRDDLKLLADANRWAIATLARPYSGDIAWVIILEDPTNSSIWRIMKRTHGKVTNRSEVPRTPRMWGGSIYKDFKAWQAEQS